MHRRAFFGVLIAGLAVPAFGAMAQERLERRESRLDNERCERLEHERDRADRARIEHRLNQLREEREHCRR